MKINKKVADMMFSLLLSKPELKALSERIMESIIKTGTVSPELAKEIEDVIAAYKAGIENENK